MLTTPLQHAASTGTISTEIRAHVKALPTDKRYEFLKASQEAGDTTTLCAVLGAPAFLSGMTQVDRDVYTRLYHESKAPDAAKRLSVMKKARDLIYDRSGMIFPETEKAVGASQSKINMLRKARNEAERAFIVRDAQ
ncbi:MAG: hypothetical protein EOO38_12600 [Cytophagaceae bacterium]|nr:MAG: hypothetical protein EOO38_12600 [Cytophagaceae bacterium]